MIAGPAADLVRLRAAQQFEGGSAVAAVDGQRRPRDRYPDALEVRRQRKLFRGPLNRLLGGRIANQREHIGERILNDDILRERPRPSHELSRAAGVADMGRELGENGQQLRGAVAFATADAPLDFMLVRARVIDSCPATRADSASTRPASSEPFARSHASSRAVASLLPSAKATAWRRKWYYGSSGTCCHAADIAARASAKRPAAANDSARLVWRNERFGSIPIPRRNSAIARSTCPIRR